MIALLVAVVTAAPTAAPTLSPCFPEEAGVAKGAVVQTDDVPLNEGSFSATISVLVGPDGKVEKVTIAKSSGNFRFDMESVSAAKRSTYTPKKVDCVPVEGTVLFNTSFTPPP